MGISDIMTKLYRELLERADYLALFQITALGVGVLLCQCCFPLENAYLLFNSTRLEWDTIYVGLQSPRMHTQLLLINWVEVPILFVLPLSYMKCTFLSSSKTFIQSSDVLELAPASSQEPNACISPQLQSSHFTVVSWTWTRRKYFYSRTWQTQKLGISFPPESLVTSTLLIPSMHFSTISRDYFVNYYELVLDTW